MQNKVVKFVITLQGKIIKKFAFEKGKPAKLIVGKSSSNADIVVNQDYISKEHLQLSKDVNDNIFIKDLKSTNGVYVNGEKIPFDKTIKIKIGDIIQFMPDSVVQLLVLSPEIKTEIEHKKKTSPISSSETIYNLINKKTKISIGRSPDCDIVIDTDFASKVHAFIEKQDSDSFIITDNNSTNGTYINEYLLTNSKKIGLSDEIRIGNYEFKLSDYLGAPKRSSDESLRASLKLKKILAEKGNVTIGRSAEADIQIVDNLVSRKHARISFVAGVYYIEDLHSANGIFVNKKKINKKTAFTEYDEIRIGLNILRLDGKSVTLSNYTAIRAEGITKKYSNGYVGLKPMSFNIPARSFIAMMGPSGCGKTTLMNMLNGANPATKGRVYIHGLELTQNFDLLKQKIGYVPQDDIVHKELSVDKSLYYAAKLRMNKDTTDKEIWQRIEEVCASLNINDKEIRKNKVKDLSGGQRKRVSIAVELLNKPSILFLDEPTSPLDPETIDGFLDSIKKLTIKEKTTIIMVTHKPSDLKYVDRVIFLAKKGYPAYYGSEEEIYSYFQIKNRNIIEVYSKLSETNKLKYWYKKWEQTHRPEVANENPAIIRSKMSTPLFRQFYWLSKRYANIKINDITNMAILMFQPVLIPLALIYIFSDIQLGVLFMMAISAIWFGVSNSAKEIVSELPIYTRERMFNLNIFTYLFSKITILSFIALFQILIFVFIINLKFSSDKIYLANTIRVTEFMFYLAFSATLLGLLISVIFKNAEQVMSVIPIILIPQIIFAGVIADIDTKDKEFISYIMLGRWGTEGLARIQNDVEEFKYYPFSATDSLIINSNEKVKILQIKKPVRVVTDGTNKYAEIQEIFVPKKDTVSVYSACNEQLDWDHKNVSCEPEIHSVYAIVPATYSSKDTLLLKDQSLEKKYPVPYTWQSGKRKIKTDPVKDLGFYQNKNLLNIFDSFLKNIIAITIINILVFVFIFIFLKKKDRI